jgi:hypothetical protein
MQGIIYNNVVTNDIIPNDASCNILFMIRATISRNFASVGQVTTVYEFNR